MKVKRIEIEQQRAQISIDIEQARLRVKSPKRRMKVTHEPAEMTVTREAPGIQIDMGKLKSNTGLKTYDELNTEAALTARNEALQGIRDAVNTSKAIGDVKSQGNRIGRAAKQRMLAPVQPDMGRSPVPPGPVEVEGDPGKIEIEWTNYDILIAWEGESSPEIYVEPPCSVEVEISSKPQINISVKDVNIPAHSGRSINAEA